MMDQKVVDIDRAKYWEGRGYHFDPKIYTALMIGPRSRTDKGLALSDCAWPATITEATFEEQRNRFRSLPCFIFRFARAPLEADSNAIVVPAPLPCILLHPTRNERFIVASQEIFFAFNTLESRQIAG